MINAASSSASALLTGAFASVTGSASGTAAGFPLSNPLGEPDYVLSGGLASLTTPSGSALSNALYGEDVAKILSDPYANGAIGKQSSYVQQLLAKLDPSLPAASTTAPATSTTPTTTTSTTDVTA